MKTPFFVIGSCLRCTIVSLFENGTNTGSPLSQQEDAESLRIRNLKASVPPAARIVSEVTFSPDEEHLIGPGVPLAACSSPGSPDPRMSPPVKVVMTANVATNTPNCLIAGSPLDDRMRTLTSFTFPFTTAKSVKRQPIQVVRDSRIPPCTNSARSRLVIMLTRANFLEIFDVSNSFGLEGIKLSIKWDSTEPILIVSTRAKAQEGMVGIILPRRTLKMMPNIDRAISKGGNIKADSRLLAPRHPQSICPARRFLIAT